MTMWIKSTKRNWRPDCSSSLELRTKSSEAWRGEFKPIWANGLSSWSFKVFNLTFRDITFLKSFALQITSSTTPSSFCCLLSRSRSLHSKILQLRGWVSAITIAEWEPRLQWSCKSMYLLRYSSHGRKSTHHSRNTTSIKMRELWKLLSQDWSLRLSQMLSLDTF